MSGMDNNFRLILNNKNQWSKIPGRFNTTSISFDSWQEQHLSWIMTLQMEWENFLQ